MQAVEAFAEEETVVEVEEEENEHDSVEISARFPKQNQQRGEARENQRRNQKPLQHAMSA